MNYGLFLLSRRDYSYGELYSKMREHYRGQSTELDLIDETLDRLLELRYLDDQRFAESFVRKESRRLQGPMKIKWSLQQKKVASNLIEAALQQIDWQDICSQALDAKFQQSAQADQNKIYRFLASRGFSSEHIQDSLSHYFA